MQDQQPPPPLPHHDVAGQSLNMDLFKAEIGGEAQGPGSLQGADQALIWRQYSCQMAWED